MRTIKHYSQEDLERAVRLQMTPAQAAKFATLEPLGWRIQKSVTNEAGETGVFIYREVGKIYSLLPPTADARLITANQKGTINYNLRTWERV